ncbi:hypothetical protein LCGC14_2240100 [marine sediment metagenome]|uniref:Uncharacterized protein n=1 Tax=marine sediment metagenome TaxID=412755 RepID=A0A0F9D5E6_9ZZZZ
MYDEALNIDEKVLVDAPFESDGFTLRYSISANADIVVGYLALGGVDMNVGRTSVTNITGTVTKTGVGFEPTGALLFGFDEVLASNHGAEFVVGGQDAEGNEGYMLAQVVGGSPSDNGVVVKQASGFMYGGILEDSTGVPVIIAEASLTSFDADGITYAWGTNNLGSLDGFYYVRVLLRAGAGDSDVDFVRGIVFADGWSG